MRSPRSPSYVSPRHAASTHPNPAAPPPPPSPPQEPWACFFAFNVFEGMCGIYFPSVGTMRGKFIPEEVRATVMNFFRIGLNFIVVMVLLNVRPRHRCSLD